MIKAAIFFAAITIAFSCLARPLDAAQATDIKPSPLEITLAPNKQNNEVGLKVHVTVTNSSQESLGFSTVRPLVSYTIRDSRGNDVLERSREDESHKTGPRPGIIASGGGYKIMPGRTIEVDEDLSSKYLIRPHVTYTITAMVLLGPKWTSAKSSPLIVVSGKQ